MKLLHYFVIIFLFLSCSKTNIHKQILNKDGTVSLNNKEILSDDHIDSSINETLSSSEVLSAENEGKDVDEVKKVNKKIPSRIFIGDIGPGIYPAIGVLKRIEKDGFWIKKISGNQSGDILSYLYLKGGKSTFVEWKMHQWLGPNTVFSENNFGDSLDKIIENINNEWSDFAERKNSNIATSNSLLDKNSCPQEVSNNEDGKNDEVEFCFSMMLGALVVKKYQNGQLLKKLHLDLQSNSFQHYTLIDLVEAGYKEAYSLK